MTRHSDEIRDESMTDWALAEVVLDDPTWFTKYRGLRGRDAAQRARIVALEKQVKDLEQIKRENNDLKRRLASAHGALDAYRRESKRLKDDLKRVRGSRSYRLGRGLTKPLDLARALPKAAARLGDTRRSESASVPALTSAAPAATPQIVDLSQQKNPGQGPMRGQAEAQPGSERTTANAGARRLSEWTYEELKEQLLREPAAAHLHAVLSRAWYAHGMVAEPAELLRGFSDLVGDLPPKAAALAEQIRGAERVRTMGIPLPPRSLGPAYHPERERVMYCAHSTPVFNTNGYSTRTKGVAAGLRAAGEDVVVVARSGYPWDSRTDSVHPTARRHTAIVDEVEYVHLPGGSVDLPTDQYILICADAFVREARLQRPSVIHAASNFRTGLPALIAARRLGLPFVYEVRGLWEITEASDKPGWESTERHAEQVTLESLVATEADAVLAITTEVRDELIRRGVDPTRITLAPNAVDPNTFLPLPKDDGYARRVKVRTDVPIIGFAGSIVPYEGLSTLIDAADILLRDGVEFQVVLAGSGSAEEALKRQVHLLGIGAHVRFLGRIPNASMPRLLSLIDIMPLPRLSLPVTEMVSPLKPLESLSSAKAVVLSDVSPHLVFAGPDEQRALVFPAGDAHALADRLRSLLVDPDARAALGRAGRLWCLSERTWTGLAAVMAQAHDRAAEVHRECAAVMPRRRVSDLRVGLIADEFTTSTLAGSVEVVGLHRANWTEQLDGLDMIFIESAWNGNGGEWHRGVGRYDDAEHADVVRLLEAARERGISSVFWNKEDPVHFARFVETASLCDHVFTTDANMVLPYLRAGTGVVKTASALPFYAQPKIHNPLPGARPFERSVAYAGTYYGDRYAKRSLELRQLLGSARQYGLSIYDRQAAIPDSPYRFPAEFQEYVRGSLPYSEVIDSYKAHVANLNVNSVSDSPSMFSRRVVEVAASAGVVLSGPGRGIDETFGSAIATSADPAIWRALVRAWSVDPQLRLGEAWMQMRAVLRSHTVDTALTVLARTAGFAVDGPFMPSYAVRLDTADGETADTLVRLLLTQSVLPKEVLARHLHLATCERLAANGIDVVEEETDVTADFVGVMSEGLVEAPLPRTWFEDMLLADAFGPWERIEAGPEPDLRAGDPLARRVEAPSGTDGLVARGVLERCGTLEDALHSAPVAGVRLVTPAPIVRVVPPVAELSDALARPQERTVLVAGHDLKFAVGLIASLEADGVRVITDEWASHVEHDEERSRELLEQADVILCEWGLGNAVWYSREISPRQRLVVRVHSQELRRPYLGKIAHENVAAYIFVGELIRQAAIRGHGVPAAKAVVVPNAVDTLALDLPKQVGAEHTIGFVGLVPRSKRLDLALEIIERLRQLGHPHVLRLKGKTPADYPWMADRPDEMAWYERQYERIEALNADRPGTVVFDGHGDDMPEWYQNIGIALSTSDFESFHLTIADGAASGALPVLLAWPGADLVYPVGWMGATVDDLVDRILSAPARREDVQSVARARFDAARVNAQLKAVILG